MGEGTFLSSMTSVFSTQTMGAIGRGCSKVLQPFALRYHNVKLSFSDIRTFFFFFFSESQQAVDNDGISEASENNFYDTFLSSGGLFSDATLPGSPPRVANLDALVSTSVSKTKKRPAKTNLTKRAELPSSIRDFANGQVCLRRAMLDWFRESQLPAHYPRQWCCSMCNPALGITDIELDIGESSVSEPDDHDAQLKGKIRTWLQCCQFFGS